MAKIDLANAYRSVPVHPSNFAATGLKWTFKGDTEPTYMVDTRLPFGARRSPEIFHELGKAVQEIMRVKGHPAVIVYLDDFLVIGKSYDQCQATFDTLMKLLRQLGFSINYSKVETPTRRLCFLGIVLDTTTMTLELPKDKLVDIKQCLISAKSKTKLTKRHLQSIAGKLNWACQCIQGGRTFMRRILDAIPKLRSPWHRMRVNKDMKADIDWWLRFLEPFNGRTQMIDKRPIEPLWTDACNIAAGAVFKGEFVYTSFGSWPGASSKHINYKETLALETAVRQWASSWTNRRVMLYCDNQAAVALIFVN